MPIALLWGIWLAATPTPPVPVEPSPRFPKGTARMELGPAPEGLKSWNEAECASCHPAEASAWERSGHASARGDFVFEAALHDDPPEWCNQCHSPLTTRPSERTLPPGAPAEERGITCAACHASSGAVVGPHGAEAPHATRAEPALRDSAFCAHCHQFGFDLRHNATGPIELSHQRMQQDSYGEWLAWRARSQDTRSCQDCHMPGGDHSFGGIRREESLRRVLHVEVLPEAKALLIRTTGVGHALPTGDVMRWLSLEVATDVLFTTPVTVGRFGRTLGVQQWPSEPEPHLGVIADTRLPASDLPATRVELPPPPAGQHWAAWRLVYHLVSESQEHRGTVPAQVSRVVLHAGTLEP